MREGKARKEDLRRQKEIMLDYWDGVEYKEQKDRWELKIFIV